MLQLDHLVMASATLAEGAAWCKRVFGITPATGGKHAFMGTHNLLFSVACERIPNAYAEIIAIDPEGAVPNRPRWFGLDAPALRLALRGGPQLIHWVARSNDIHATSAAWRLAGLEPGAAVAAERTTPNSVLRWQIALQAGGARPFGGALPTLIEWGEVHPCDALPASGVRLDGVQLIGLPAPCRGALRSVDGVACAELNESADRAPTLVATLMGPCGPVTLSSLPTEPTPCTTTPTA